MSDLKPVPDPSEIVESYEDEVLRALESSGPSEKRPKPTTLDRAALLETLSNLQARKQELANAFQQVVGAEGVISQLLALMAD